MELNNRKIASMIKLGGQLLELHGENSFKTKAYENAATRIKQFHTPILSLTEEQMEKVDGIGKTLVKKLVQIKERGSYDELDQLLQTTPKGVVILLNIRGIGAKKATQMWKELDITSPDEALDACKEGLLEDLKGFGAKTQENIQEVLEFYFESLGKCLYMEAEIEADFIIDAIKNLPEIKRIEPTGGIRRKCPVLDKIEFLIEVDEDFNLDELVEKTNVLKKEKNQIKTIGLGMPVNFYTSNYKDWVGRLFETTGHAQHLKKINPETYKNVSSESEIYLKNNLPFIIPEMREGLDEFDVMHGIHESKIIKNADLMGCLHNHSTYSDGAKTVRQMANYCIDKGYEYFGISDHSQSAFYAKGMQPYNVFKQWEEIDELNKTYNNFILFKGIESDILNTGELDYEDDILKRFDFVVASIHSNLKMTEAAATKRLIKAIENPYTTILGHMTGRLLLQRQAYPVNHKMIIDACAANGVVMELNANPRRMDIDWTWLRYCMDKGVMISINPDAHDDDQIDFMYFGVLTARKAGVTKEMVLNTKPLHEITEIFNRKRTLSL
ncbi:MAG: PHP domain-containing protein [Bacteroidetes bacterium]|nr:PHP domain-containing protein [Bacteroidota bacterium]